MATTTAVAAAANATTTDATTNFSDIVKNSVLESFTSDISITHILLSMGIAFLVGLLSISCTNVYSVVSCIPKASIFH